jgi:hypothetical protein
LDAEFNRTYTQGDDGARRKLIKDAFPDMPPGLLEEFATRRTDPIAEFIFNQQTSIASSQSIADALRVLLAAVESGKREI